MKILSRYLIFSFLRPFLFSLLLFSILIFLGHLFERMDTLASSQAPFSVLFAYLWLQVPFWAVRILPVATLMATLFCMGHWMKMGEWVAVLACGFHPGRFLLPLYAASLAVAGLSFLASETLVPWCYRSSRRLYEHRIKGKELVQRTHWENLVLVAGPEQIFMAGSFDLPRGRMERVLLDLYQGTAPIEQLDAQSAQWDPHRRHWIFSEGVRRQFRSDGTVKEEPFQRWVSQVQVSPQKLSPEEKDPDEMSFRELRHYTRKLRARGFPDREAAVEMHLRLALAATNFFICALGIPLALRLKAAGWGSSFGLATVAAFLFWGLLSVFQALGEGGDIPAWLAAWMPDVTVAAAAFYLQKRQRLF